jgi:hypothetical protein
MGAATEAITIRPTHNAIPRKVRISSRVKVAIDAMVMGGLSRPDAAKHAGIEDNTLYIALRKPEVLQYRSAQMEVMRTSESSRTFARIAKLADNADSEHVRLDASKHLGALDGISPVTKSESTINHKGLGPGLTIIMSQPEPVLVIDSQAHEVEYVSREKHLSAPVPHPSVRNAQLEAANLRGNQPADRLGGGEKRRKPR